jgi:hypothetical protein
MPKATDAEKNLILKLHNEGHKDAYIAEQLGWDNPTAVRSVARYRKQIKTEHHEVVEQTEEDKTLDEMSRFERYDLLKLRLPDSPRCKMVFESLTDQEQKFFLDEYFRIIKETDSLTAPEEQSLFAATVEFVLAYRALSFAKREQDYYQQSLNGDFQEDDIRYRRTDRSETYQKQYDTHMKLNSKNMDTLKMNRKDRMKEIKSERRTLVDLAQELSSKNAQANAAEEIERLTKLKDEELKRLIDNNYLRGVFGQ